MVEVIAISTESTSIFWTGKIDVGAAERSLLDAQVLSMFPILYNIPRGGVVELYARVWRDPMVA